MTILATKRLTRISLATISAFLAVCSAEARPLQCRDVPYLFEAYLQNHYAAKELNATIKQQVVEQFIKSLDPSKTMVLENDITSLRNLVSSVFATVKSGNCDMLQETHKLMVRRAKETEGLVRKILGDGYKLDESTEVILNPDKRVYAKTLAEKEETLRKMVHFQISNYLIADMSLSEARKQLVHRYELITKRTVERKPADMLENYMEAFATGLDPHSSYLSKDNLDDFQIQMQLSLEGIGASLSSQDGYTVVENVIPGGGADRIKVLKPKDKIIAVAQSGEKPVAVIDMELRDVVKMIRGKKGTKVTLTILRQAEKTERFDVTIVRDKIDLKEQAAKLTFKTQKAGDKALKIGVIDLPSFYGGGEGGNKRSSYKDVRDLLEKAKKEKVDGIVLDLSRNGGGILDDAVKMSGLFIRKGGIVSTQNTQGKVELLSDTDPEVVYSGPLVVLTSRASASASEILAGALRDYGRAIVVGDDHTFGKGTVQALAPLPDDLGAMKVTIGMYFLPKGESTQHKGVSADIILPSGLASDDFGEKTLSYSLAPRTIDPFVSGEANPSDQAQRWTPVDGAVVRKLAARSQERVSKHPKFIEIKKAAEKAAKNNGIVRLAEIRKEALDEKKKDKDKDAKRGPGSADKEKEDSVFVEESVNVLVDYLTLAKG